MNPEQRRAPYDTAADRAAPSGRSARPLFRVRRGPDLRALNGKPSDQGALARSRGPPAGPVNVPSSARPGPLASRRLDQVATSSSTSRRPPAPRRLPPPAVSRARINTRRLPRVPRVDSRQSKPPASDSSGPRLPTSPHAPPPARARESCGLRSRRLLARVRWRLLCWTERLLLALGLKDHGETRSGVSP